MNDLFAFLAGSCIVIWLSRKPLLKPGSHGFYRFFAWEAILGLIVLNHSVWGADPYSPHQFTSWILMLLSIFLVIAGVSTLKSHGAANAQRDDGSFYDFEKTTQLVSNGIFGYIRHPMYSAVLLGAAALALTAPPAPAWLAWTALLLVLLVKARLEERSMAEHHPDYTAYRTRTKRLVPGLF